MTQSLTILDELREIIKSGNLDQIQLKVVAGLFSSTERLLTGQESVNGIVGIANDFTLPVGESVALVDTTAGDVTLTLPESSDVLNVSAGTTTPLYIKKIDTGGNSVIITPASGTIDGAGTLSLTLPREGVIIVPDGDDWQVIATTGGGGGGGGGDVLGPASATDNAVARYNGTSGNLIQDSPVTIDDSGNMSGVGTIDGTVAIDTVGTPTVDTLSEFLARDASPGVFQNGGLITDDGDGTVTLVAGSGLIRATDSDVATLLSFEWASAALTPTDNSQNYVYVEYNAGSPQGVITTTERTDVNTNILIGTVYRQGTTLHITNRPVVLASAIRDLHRRFVAVEGLSRASGVVASETGTRNIAFTQGEFWLGLDRYDILTGGFDSSVADTFIRFYRDGVGGWTEETAQTQIPNTTYDDGTGTLGTLGVNRYGVHWIYVDIDGDVFSVYGRGNYTLAQAIAASPPADLPPHLIDNHGLLAAKVIIQDSLSTFESLESAFETQFAGNVIADHGNLAGLGDDDHTQYHRTDGTRAMTGDLDMGANAITNVGNVDGVDVSAHAARHITGGADEIDGDQLDIDYTPTNYTPTISPAEVTNLDHLTAHIAGIDTALAASGGAPTVDTLEGFTTGNRYDAAANGYAGVATGFVFGGLFEILDYSASGQIVWHNTNFGTDGWALAVEPNNTFQVYFFDSVGAQVAAASTAFTNTVDFFSQKLFLVLGQVTQNGANNDITIWVNGQNIATAVGSNPYAPVTDIAQIGAGPFGNVAADLGISGVCYYEGTLTDAQIRDWYHECYDARDIVDNGIGMTIFSVKRGSPGATWTESDGTGPDMNRTGSLTTVNRNAALWG